jgi:eukaryotic-like serine/threonine-protein kinase
MATVYRAHDDWLKRDVAVKLIAGRLAQDGLAVRRFRREAELGARLGHPNVVTVFDAGLEPQDFIVMELVAGVDAGTLLRKTGAVTFQHAARIVGPICEALQHAHDQNVIHGDVSLRNILILESDGTPKLADFGLASDAGAPPEEHPPGVKGTPGYIAPEILSGDAPSPRSDLYSLAAIIQRLLTGPVAALHGDPGTTLPAATAVVRLPRLGEERPDLPGALTDAVEQALSRDPDARQASVAEFRAQFVAATFAAAPVASAA